MKTRTWMVALAMVGSLMFAGRPTQGDQLAIQSFGTTGRLTFNEVPGATGYRVEWAASAAGPWTNFAAAAGLDAIPPTGVGVVTAAVPTCYRVVADVADYLVVDLSTGPTASNYPVSYLTNGPDGGWTDDYKTTKMVFRRIPAGAFTMGSPANELGRDNDEGQHQVTLTQPFYIGVFQVTQKQWERVMGTWPSWFNNASYRDARPAEQVSYNDIRGSNAGAGWPANNNVDATSFIGKLRAKTGKVFDLPTESQWEYAGRAGTTTALNSGKNLTDAYQCPNMDEVGRYWYNGGSGYSQNGDTSGGTAKVGSYRPNQWGLYDIHGNVWEWCLDWFPGYEGSYRVGRGGGWNRCAYDCRVARRGKTDPYIASSFIGFRVTLPSGQ